ncbi:hypothetical protein [Pseudomonas synxantha]|uniref:hypothetical protein n=1 Tax=Pseudomonas synxantha TaxID=47883 RepID=UPI00117AECAA|nr:hypothetical protein [Pseudomonas synxantha]
MASIEIFGQDGHVLIDQNYKNLILLEKFKGSFDGGGGVVRGGTYTVSRSAYPGTTPVLAISSTFLTALRRFTRNGNDYTWVIACEAAGRLSSADFYIFNVPNAIPSADGILQIFNSGGELVFDSSLDYCKVQGMLSASTGQSNTLAVPVGGEYAYVVTIPPYIYSVTNFLIMNFTGVVMQSGSVRSASFDYSVQGYPAQPPFLSGRINWAAKFLIIDVANI